MMVPGLAIGLAVALLVFALGAVVGWISCAKRTRRRVAERAIARAARETREDETGGVVRDLRQYKAKRNGGGAA